MNDFSLLKSPKFQVHKKFWGIYLHKEKVQYQTRNFWELEPTDHVAYALIISMKDPTDLKTFYQLAQFAGQIQNFDFFHIEYVRDDQKYQEKMKELQAINNTKLESYYFYCNKLKELGCTNLPEPPALILDPQLETTDLMIVTHNQSKLWDFINS